MKSLAIGCFGAFIGLIAGAAIVLIGSRAIYAFAPSNPAQSNIHPDLSITASASFLESQIQQSLRANNLGKDATVTFATPNLVRVEANTQSSVLGLALNANLKVVMSVTVASSRLRLKIESVSAGNLPAPQAVSDVVVERLRAQAEDQMNREIQNVLRGTNLHLANIRISENDVTLELIGQ